MANYSYKEKSKNNWIETIYVVDHCAHQLRNYKEIHLTVPKLASFNSKKKAHVTCIKTITGQGITGIIENHWYIEAIGNSYSAKFYGNQIDVSTDEPEIVKNVITDAVESNWLVNPHANNNNNDYGSDFTVRKRNVKWGIKGSGKNK